MRAIRPPAIAKEEETTRARTNVSHHPQSRNRRPLFRRLSGSIAGTRLTLHSAATGWVFRRAKTGAAANPPPSGWSSPVHFLDPSRGARFYEITKESLFGEEGKIVARHPAQAGHSSMDRIRRIFCRV